MRPKAINIFELLFGAGLVVGMANFWLLGTGASFINVAPFLISLALGLWASRGRSNVARWILAVMSILGVLGEIWLAARGYGEAAGGVLGLVATVLQLGAVAMLFTPGARGWFARRDAAETV